MFYALKSWLLSLRPDTQLQLYTALIATLVLVINVSRFIYDVNKDQTKIKIEIKRDSDSPLATLYPSQEILVIQAINEGSNFVILNEVGIVVQGTKYINIDILKISSISVVTANEIMGNVDWVSIPGKVNPQSLGAVIISFSHFEKICKNIKEGQELSLEESNYLKTGKKPIDVYEKLMNSYNASTKELTVKPYTVTATGQRFIGKETKIQLGNLMEL
jgi:hypothetical protein